MDARREPGQDAGRELLVRYEALRARVLTGDGRRGQAQGWALFAREGMAAWLSAWRELAPVHDINNTTYCNNYSVTMPEEQREIVRVWTSMVLAHLPGAKEARHECKP